MRCVRASHPILYLSVILFIVIYGHHWHYRVVDLYIILFNHHLFLPNIRCFPILMAHCRVVWGYIRGLSLGFSGDTTLLY